MQADITRCDPLGRPTPPVEPELDLADARTWSDRRPITAKSIRATRIAALTLLAGSAVPLAGEYWLRGAVPPTEAAVVAYEPVCKVFWKAGRGRGSLRRGRMMTCDATSAFVAANSHLRHVRTERGFKMTFAYRDDSTAERRFVAFSHPEEARRLAAAGRTRVEFAPGSDPKPHLPWDYSVFRIVSGGFLFLAFAVWLSPLVRRHVSGAPYAEKQQANS